MNKEITCKDCKRVFIRTKVAPYKNGQSKFIDDTGKICRGIVCSLCCAIRDKIRKKRYEEKEDLGPELQIYWDHKKCIKCKDKLEIARYNTCTLCKPELGEDLDIIYCEGLIPEAPIKPSDMTILAGGI